MAQFIDNEIDDLPAKDNETKRCWKPGLCPEVIVLPFLGYAVRHTPLTAQASAPGKHETVSIIPA